MQYKGNEGGTNLQNDSLENAGSGPASKGYLENPSRRIFITSLAGAPAVIKEVVEEALNPKEVDMSKPGEEFERIWAGVEKGHNPDLWNVVNYLRSSLDKDRDMENQKSPFRRTIPNIITQTLLAKGNYLINETPENIGDKRRLKPENHWKLFTAGDKKDAQAPYEYIRGAYYLTVNILGNSKNITDQLDYLKTNSKAETEKWILQRIEWNNQTPKTSLNLAITLKETNEFIGWVGIGELDNKEIGEMDFGYAILPKFQRNGFAAETLKAIIDYCFKNMTVTKIFGDCDKNNIASRKVMEKCGLRFEKEADGKVYLAIRNVILDSSPSASSGSE